MLIREEWIISLCLWDFKYYSYVRVTIDCKAYQRVHTINKKLILVKLNV